jgi:hypothetical protein
VPDAVSWDEMQRAVRRRFGRNARLAFTDARGVAALVAGPDKFAACVQVASPSPRSGLPEAGLCVVPVRWRAVTSSLVSAGCG